MTGSDCLICNRWATPEDHEGYRAYVRDPEYRYALAPMSFSEWLRLDEIHHGHRDQAAMLDRVLDTKREDMHGLKMWHVPVLSPVLAESSDLPIEVTVPTFRTEFRSKTYTPSGETWLELTIDGFGVAASETVAHTDEARSDEVFDFLRYKVVHVMATALAQKQRSER